MGPYGYWAANKPKGSSSSSNTKTSGISKEHSSGLNDNTFSELETVPTGFQTIWVLFPNDFSNSRRLITDHDRKQGYKIQ